MEINIDERGNYIHFFGTTGNKDIFFKNIRQAGGLLFKKPNTQYRIKNIEIYSSIEHKHGVENYGFIFKTNKYKIGLVTDTAYFPELLNSYKDCEMLIMNVPYHIQDKPKPKHLNITNVEEFIKEIKPKKVILTHFNCNILNDNPINLADELSQRYNLEVIAAEDDMILKI